MRPKIVNYAKLCDFYFVCILMQTLARSWFLYATGCFTNAQTKHSLGLLYCNLL